MAPVYAAEPEVVRVLVIDPDPNAQATYSRALNGAGYDLVFAHEGIDGVCKVWDHKPGIVFAAIDLPRLDGFKVCEIIRRHPQFQQVAVLLVAPSAGLFEKSHAMLAGASDYLAKPLSEEQVAGALLQYTS